MPMATDRIAYIVDFQHALVEDAALIRAMNNYLSTLRLERYHRAIFSRSFPELLGEYGWNLACDPTMIPHGISIHEIRKTEVDVWDEPAVYVTPLSELPDPDNLAGRSHRDRFFSEELNIGVTVEISGVGPGVEDAVAGFVARKFRIELITNLIDVAIQRIAQDRWPGNGLIFLRRFDPNTGQIIAYP